MTDDPTRRKFEDDFETERWQGSSLVKSLTMVQADEGGKVGALEPYVCPKARGGIIVHRSVVCHGTEV